MATTLALVGCGYTLLALARRQVSQRVVLASTRDAERAAELQRLGAQVVEDHVALARQSAGADVVVSLPPDAGLDERVCAALPDVRKLVYVSSTGVYGKARGEVDETTPVEPSARADAEDRYRAKGAVILRASGIYGPGRSLLDRLRAGTFRMPGEGANRISRIHVEDLCAAIECALDRAPSKEVYNAADDSPVPIREVVQWLCERHGLPMPPSAPLEQMGTLSGDRAISNQKLRALGWAPRFPSYREGMA